MHTGCATPDSTSVLSFQEIGWQREEIDVTSNQINHGEQARPDTANEGDFLLAQDRLLEPPPYEEVTLPSIPPQPASDSSMNTTNTSNRYVNFLYDNDLYFENDDNSEPPPPYSKYDSVPSLTVGFEPDIGRVRAREADSDTLVLIDGSASDQERVRPTKMAGTFSLAFCAAFFIMTFYGSGFSPRDFGFHEYLFVAVHFGAVYLATRNL